MNTAPTTQEIEQTLNLLGSNSLDLSSQPQTFKGITKKLNKIVHDLNSFEVIPPAGLDNIQEQIDKIKSDVPKWVLVDEIPGDGRLATPEDKEQASLILDELEAYINSASTENLLDIHCAIAQSLVIATEQKYNFDKLTDYRDNLKSTRLVSKDTHRNLSQLGMGIESSLPNIELFTDTPSGVNYQTVQATLEDKSGALSKLLKLMGSLGLTVILTVALNYLLRFAFYLADVVEKKIRGWSNRNKKATTTDRTVSTKRYKQRQQAQSAGKAGEVYKYAKAIDMTVDEISLAGLYRDTANGRLKEAEIEDLYAAASTRNIKDMKTLWETMQNVLDSVYRSLKDTTIAMTTMQTTQTINDPAIDPAALEDSVVTVRRVEDSFKKYESPKVDIQQGLDIIKEVAQIYAKGDLQGFEKRLNNVKKRLAELDKTFNKKHKENELSDEMRDFLMKRIYLLKTATEYLSNNIKLQTRFQTLAIRHAKIFEANLESMEAFEVDIDKNEDIDDAQPA